MTKRWDRVLIFGLLLAVILSMAAGFDNECETVGRMYCGCTSWPTATARRTRR